METLEFLCATEEELDGQLAAVLDALPDGIAVLDESGIIVFVNHRLQELSRYDGGELIGRHVDYLVPDDLSKAFELQRDLFVDPAIIRPMVTGLDTHLHQKDGSPVPVDIQLSAISVGTNPFVLASIRDITQRKGNDEALRRSEERFRNFVEAAPVMMFSLLPDGVIHSVNVAFEQRTGWRRDDLIGTHFAPLVHADDLADAISTLGQFIRGEAIDDDEVRILTTSGDYLETQISVVPLPSDDQGVEMIGVIHDITEQRRTEEELSKTKERFRQAFKQAPLGIALTDHAGRITNVNHALCDFLGYPSDDLIGISLSSLVHPDDVATDVHLMRRIDSGTAPTEQIDQRFVTKGGDVVQGTMTASVVLDERGQRLYGMRVVADITERKKLERELATLASVAKSKLATLTPRELEILESLDGTVTAAELGTQFFISARTVESHLANAYRKFGVRTRSEALASFARMKSLVTRFDPDRHATPHHVAT
jgi:PAS domain S-box-containing protein